MHKLRKSKWVKVLAVSLAIHMVTSLVFPSMTWALTSGPKQPEFATFQSVNTNQMVDPFSGNFSYTLPVLQVPGPNGGGYAVALSYNSNITPEQESSWCGLGWNINPGAIQRGKRGIPDEKKNLKIKRYAKAPTNWTISGTTGIEVEGESFNLSDALRLSAQYTMRFNNYKGFASTIGVNPSLNGNNASLSLGIQFGTSQELTVRPQFMLNPAAILRGKNEKLQSAANEAVKWDSKLKETKYNSLLGKILAQNRSKERIDRTKEELKTGQKQRSSAVGSIAALSSAYSGYLLEDPSYSSGGTPFTGETVQFSYSMGPNILPANLNLKMGMTGTFSQQTATKYYEQTGVGSMNLENAITPGSVETSKVMDYQVLMEDVYSKRDNYLPIPVSTEDFFRVSGEGIGGSYKLMRDDVGHFMPAYQESYTSEVEAGLPLGEIKLGSEIEVAAPSFQIGGNTNSISGWRANKLGNTSSRFFRGPRDETSKVFAFTGDIGLNRDITSTDAASTAVLERAELELPSEVGAYVTTSSDGRSSSIEYNTINEMKEWAPGINGDSVYYNSFTKNTQNRNLFIGEGDLGDDIGEFCITNGGGTKYVYGLPVYAAREMQMMYGVHPLAASDLVDDHFVKTSALRDPNVMLDSREVKYLSGTIIDEPVAQSYLLTEIVGTNYIDVDFNGPSDNDYGAWTKFDYRQAHGTKGGKNYLSAAHLDEKLADWYTWRSPFNGLRYERNDRTDLRDDMGLVATGVKEIYYLEAVETKTHKAFFVTNTTDIDVVIDGVNVSIEGSGTPRYDAIEAASNIEAASDFDKKGDGQLEKLEKIMLYKKGANGELTGKPIQVAHLEYFDQYSDKSLCKNVPNATSSGVGKLTLKRVWFEFEGIHHGVVRPYEFGYEYKAPNFFSNDIQDKYPEICNYKYYQGDSTLGVKDENPDYNISGSDIWGNHRANGSWRDAKHREWVDQKELDPSYDPAAWNLKTIRLPSGGYIMPQYEQCDYTHVQGREVLGMVPLEVESSPTKLELGAKLPPGNKYYLDLSQIDLDRDEDGVISENEFARFHDIADDYVRHNKTYFKFLYKLKGTSDASLDNCKSDFITGYADCGIRREPGEQRLYIKFDDPLVHDIPRDICLDYVRKNKSGLSLDDDCYSSEDNSGMLGDNLETALGYLTSYFKTSLAPLSNGTTARLTTCHNISLSDSYFRLPLPKAKKGGGVRVKRILMYDPAGRLGEGDLYGSEYLYETEDGRSSGVASNEPTYLAQNNSLVRFDQQKRDDQKFWQRIVRGKDRQQFEKPRAKPFLPGPSVGHSRVVVQNIHKGVSSPGYSVTEFHTCKDGVNSGGVTGRVSDIKPYNPMPVILPFDDINILRKKHYAAQGYAFVTSDLHGKTKKTSTYPGYYTSGQRNDKEATSWSSYEYSTPGEELLSVDENGDVSLKKIGRNESLTMEMKQVRDYAQGYGLETDPGVALVGIVLPHWSNAPKITNHDLGMSRHVTTKHVHYTSVLKEVKSSVKGITKYQKNLVYDRASGAPLVTQVSDGYDSLIVDGSTHSGAYMTYAVPASYVYPSMGWKAKNERFVLDGKFQLYTHCVGLPSWVYQQGECHITSAFINLAGSDAEDQAVYLPPLAANGDPLVATHRGSIIQAFDDGKLRAGDLIRLSNAAGDYALMYINEFDAHKMQRVYLQPLSMVVQESIASDTRPIFDKIEVISSGYANQTGGSAGSLSTYGKERLDRWIESNGEYRAMKDSIPGLVSASAVTWSDDWYDHENANLYGDMDDLCQTPRSFEIGARGKWKPRSTYAYKTEVGQRSLTPGAELFAQIAGVFVDSETMFEGFVYQSTREDYYNNLSKPISGLKEYLNEVDNPDPWVLLNKVNTYSPHGEALEEENKLGVKSCAKFGHDDHVPVLVAGNAGLRNVLFESFEDKGYGEIQEGVAHTGNKSLLLKGHHNHIVGDVEAQKSVGDTSDYSSNALVRFWAKVDYEEIDNLQAHLQLNAYSGTHQKTVSSFQRVSTLGEWSLYEVTLIGLRSTEQWVDAVHKRGRGPGEVYQLSFVNTSDFDFSIDDIRVQPVESEMSTYVYDARNLRLLAQFDAQHFAQLFQYNAEGQLVRTMVETERGIKTVAESQYNVPGRN